jgi:hypothetical protein
MKNEFANQVKHHLAQEHVLERPQRSRVILGGEVLKRLEEVRISGRVVLILGVKNTRLQVQRRLKVGWAIDRIRSSAGGSESSLSEGWVNDGRKHADDGLDLGLGEVADSSVNAAFQKVNLCEDHFVVQPLKLRKKSIDESESRLVLSSCLSRRSVSITKGYLSDEHAQSDKSCFQTLLEEDPLLTLRPFDVVKENSWLYILAVGNSGEEVEQGTNWA